MIPMTEANEGKAIPVSVCNPLKRSLVYDKHEQHNQSSTSTFELDPQLSENFEGMVVNKVDEQLVGPDLPLEKHDTISTIKSPSIYSTPSFSTPITTERTVVLPVVHPIIYHILVVDDSDLNRKMISKTIRRALPIAVGKNKAVGVDFDVVIDEVNDGGPAVLAVENKSSLSYYDIIFMDNIMILMNGPVAVRRMRSLGYQGPVIDVTGNIMPQDVQEFLDCGADKILKKPVDPKEVSEVLEKYLRAHFQ